jgi:hypothetical protein
VSPSPAARHARSKRINRTKRIKATAVAAAAALTVVSGGALVTGPTATAAAAPSLATVHPVAPTSVADTGIGSGVRKGSLSSGKVLTVRVAGVHGLPARAASVTLAVLVTRASGSGQVRVGATKGSATAAVTATRNEATTSSFTTLLSSTGTLYVTYAGTGAVQLRLVVEAYTAGDLTGASFHPIAPVRVADTWTGRGLPAHLLAKRASVRVQVAGTPGIPASATAVLLTVNTNNAKASGAITAGATARTTAPVVTFAKGRQVTGSVLAPLTAGKVTLVNSSPGAVGITANVVGYYTQDTSGLLFLPLAPHRIVDTAAGVGSPKRPLSSRPLAVGARADAHLPTNAAAVALSVITPAQGLSAVAAGAKASTMSTVLLTTAGRAADVTTVVPLSTDGSFSIRATGRPLQALVGVVGYYAPLVRKPGPPSPPTTPPTTPVKPPVTVPTTPAGPALKQPRVSHVDPADNATGVDPSTTSVVTDLVLPNGGVMTGSLNASTVTLVAISGTTAGTQVAANYGTSGGGDTINVSPIGPLLPFTTYRFTVTPGATDVEGVPFQPFTSTFTTGAVLTPDNNIAFDKYDSGAGDQSFASLTKGPDGKLYARRLDHALHHQG